MTRILGKYRHPSQVHLEVKEAAEELLHPSRNLVRNQNFPQISESLQFLKDWLFLKPKHLSGQEIHFVSKLHKHSSSIFHSK